MTINQLKEGTLIVLFLGLCIFAYRTISNPECQYIKIQRGTVSSASCEQVAVRGTAYGNYLYEPMCRAVVKWDTTGVTSNINIPFLVVNEDRIKRVFYRYVYGNIFNRIYLWRSERKMAINRED